MTKELKDPSLAELMFARSVEHHKGLRKLQKNPRELAANIQAYVLSEDFEPTIEMYAQLIEALPKVKKHSYDQSVLDLIDGTLAIPTEEVLGQLENISLPFDQLWLEGPGFHVEGDGNRYSCRKGYLITALESQKGFTFREVLCGYGSGNAAAILVTTTVSREKGIVVDEDTLLRQLTDLSKLPGKGVEKFSLARIESFYDAADFLARLLLVLGGNRFAHNVVPDKTPEELAIEKKDRERLRMNRKPRLPATPIKIDLSRIDVRGLSQLSPKQLRVLLGWTSVRRSKPIQRKDGTFYTRKPHDRRIPSPVDRRDVARELFSSHTTVNALRPAGMPGSIAPENRNPG